MFMCYVLMINVVDVAVIEVATVAIIIVVVVDGRIVVSSKSWRDDFYIFICIARVLQHLKRQDERQMLPSRLMLKQCRAPSTNASANDYFCSLYVCVQWSGWCSLCACRKRENQFRCPRTIWYVGSHQIKEYAATEPLEFGIHAFNSNLACQCLSVRI